GALPSWHLGSARPPRFVSAGGRCSIPNTEHTWESCAPPSGRSIRSCRSRSSRMVSGWTRINCRRMANLHPPPELPDGRPPLPCGPGLREEAVREVGVHREGLPDVLLLHHDKA